MIPKDLGRLAIRVSALCVAAIAALIIVATDTQHAKPAAADPAYGSVKFNPSSSIVIEGFYFNVPIKMNTCGDSGANVLGTVTSASASSLTDTTKAWTLNQWANYSVMITTGSGSPQTRVITSNTSNTLTISGSWTAPNPAAGSGYQIIANSGVATSSGASTLTDTSKNWTANQFANQNVVLISGPGSVQQGTIASNTNNTITMTTPWGTILVPGTVSNTTTGAVTGDITGTATNGTSTTLTDTSKNWAANQWAGFTLDLTIGTGSPQSRTVQSNTANTLTVSSAFAIPLPGSGTGYTIEGSPTATTIVDSTMNWTPGQWAGYSINLTSGTGAGQTRTVQANTSNKITIQGAWSTTPAQGTGYLLGAAAESGVATSTTSTTLVDTTQNWVTSQWVNYPITITSGAGTGQTRTITANTDTTITVSPAWSGTIPTAGSGYLLGAASQVPTSTTIVDATQGAQNWIPNQFAGMSLDITSGTGSPQTRTIVSNTNNTITVSLAFAPLPAGGSGYQVRQAGNAPTAGTGYQLLKLQCHVGGYALTINFPASEFTVVSGSGQATGATSTTLVDSLQAWKINQWAGTLVRITGGTGFGQAGTVVSNTATTLTISPGWIASKIPPTVGSSYQLGGIADGGWLTSTGRALSCPTVATYGTGTASLSCVTLNAVPQGPTGGGNIVNLTLRAGPHHGNVVQPFTLTGAQILQVDGTNIPADIFAGARRVIVCPDSAPPISPTHPVEGDGIISSGDQAIVAYSVLHAVKVGDAFYTVAKDPNEDGIVSAADQSIVANQYGIQCPQQ